MKTVLITGSGGLVGSESVEFFLEKEFYVVGVDNNLRKFFFGDDGSVEKTLQNLMTKKNYKHYNVDIRELYSLETMFQTLSEVVAIIHTAAQPSHDWAVKNPHMDFEINAVGTLNMLELTRKYFPDAVFINMSTNKVYGDTPNLLSGLYETPTRYELPFGSRYYQGVYDG
jgi:CDP-paratose 2-epimerase